MKPVLLGGAAFAPTARIHSIPLASAHTGVPSGFTRQVNPLEPFCRVLALPSACAMTIVAALTMDAGAAVFAFATYSGSDLGSSEVGNCANAEVAKAGAARLNANQASVW